MVTTVGLYSERMSGASESDVSDCMSRTTVIWLAPTTGAIARDDMPLNTEKRPCPDREDQAGARVLRGEAPWVSFRG